MATKRRTQICRRKCKTSWTRSWRNGRVRTVRFRGCDRGADERKRDFGVGTGPDAALRRGRCRVHVFSTVVREASARDLAAHRFDSTCGTDIDCVLRHVLNLPRRQRPRAVVVITDGDTGTPDATLAAQFRAAGMRLFVGLVEAGPDATRDLAPLAERFVNLF